MNCSHCGFENPSDAKFCQNCGRSLDVICPNCQTPNASVAKFCKNCGHGLTAGVQSADPPLAQSSEKTADESRGERRVVTVLFCDVVGSTALGEQMDPEEWTEIMNGVFERLIAATTRYGGTVARLMGDSILTLFGAPTAHEDDPLRAVRAALDMLQDLRPYQDQITKELLAAGVRPSPTDFELRIGINTGLVVVGNVGSDQKQEYTAMGDAINLASRMEQTARPGTIQVAQDTYKLIAPLVEVEALGEVEVKGKRDPILAYQVLALKSRLGPATDLDGLEAPLVGREQEVELLQHTLSRLHEGYGQILSLIGEAGLGKSRLIQEFHQRLDHGWSPSRNGPSSNGFQWYQAESLSFEDSHPYGLFHRLLRRMAGISASDSLTLVRQKIEQLSSSLDMQLDAHLLSGLGVLFSLDDQESTTYLEGEDLKQNLLAGIVGLIQSLSAKKPTIIVFEDLHWTDPASIELITQLFALTDENPLLLVTTFRPDPDSDAWKVKEAAESDNLHRYLEINLQPLSTEESHELAANLIDLNTIPWPLAEKILQKTEGVPFFVEEIVRELIESGLLKDGADQVLSVAKDYEEIQIPDNVEAVLVARIDRLDEEARRILQLAAVVGRVFHYRVLELIADSNGHLDHRLRTLRQAGLIREASQEQEVEYMFRHALTQEAAYNTILLRHRRQYHQRVGEVMETLFENQLEEQAHLLAHHFHQAGDPRQALAYYTMAAEGAARIYANDEAIVHYSRAIEAAGHVSLDPASLAKLHRGRGLAYETLGEIDLARHDHETTLSLARYSDERQVEWQALLDLGRLWTSRDYNQSGNYFKQALDLARQIDDPVILAPSLNWTGNWYANAEEPVVASEYHQEALRIFQSTGDQRGLANTHDLLGIAYLLAGDRVASLQHLNPAIAIFRDLDDRTRLASSLAVQANAHGSQFEFDIGVQGVSIQESFKVVNESLQITRDIGWRAGESFAYWTLAQVQTSKGNYGRALESTQKGLQIASEIGHQQWATGHLCTLGMIWCSLLDGETARLYLEQALDLATEIQSKYWGHLIIGTISKAHLLLNNPTLSRTYLEPVIDQNLAMNTMAKRYCWGRWAELALMTGDPHLALDIADELMASATFLPANHGNFSISRLRSRAQAMLGELQTAEALLHESLREAEAHKNHFILWHILADLGKLYQQIELPEKAELTFDRARKLIVELAADISDESIREPFVQRARASLNPTQTK
jgi:predicted ATPase/class 3 adenylate cyclase